MKQFVAELIDALKRRQRAIKYRVSEFSYERVADPSSNIQKLEVQARGTRTRVVVRLFVWDDRWLWVDCRASSKAGWKWQWTAEGRWLGSFGVGALVAALEATIDVANYEIVSPAEFEKIWRAKLARGPRLVR